MRVNNKRLIRLGKILFGAAIMIGLFVVRGMNAKDKPVSLATDWSHRHVVFSNPKSLLHSTRLAQNPRYVHQRVQHNAERKIDWRRGHDRPRNLLQGDWSVYIGTSATVGQGMYPAKYSFDVTTANCATDFVVFNTSLAGSLTAPTIVAFNNLYDGCPGNVPSTYWAYNTGTGATAVTSVTLSGDGTQVAFMQNVGGGGAQLVILKWAAQSGTVNAPVTLTSAQSSYYGCSAPCMTTISLNGGSSTIIDTLSSPFYDFTPGSDSLYVGDDAGTLHQFTNVFNGAPAENVSNGWPVTVSGSKLTSPVYDAGSGKVFVADGGGFLHSIVPTANPPTKVSSSQLSYGNGFVDSPTLDSSTEQVYVFTADAQSSCVTSVPRSAVIQMPVGFAAGDSPYNPTPVGAYANVGICNNNGVMYAGDFDNAYYTGTGNTGNLYVCGNSAGTENTTTPTLYQIPMNGTFGSVVNQGPALAANGTGVGTNSACSSITEVYNPNGAGGARDWIFTSVTGGGVTNGVINCPAPGGCVMSFDVTSGATINGTKSTTATAAVAGGASGIVADNTVGPDTLIGASQIYFTPLATESCATSGRTGGCAIQASQSGLTVTPVSHTIQISDDQDDGYYDNISSHGWHYIPQYGDADLVGSWDGLTTGWVTGYRFPSVGANSGETIQSAYLQLVSSDGDTSSVTCGSVPCSSSNYTFRVYGVAQDDGPAFSGAAYNTPLDVPYTAAYTDYTTTGPGDVHGSCQGQNNGQNTCTHAIDVTNIVREITSRQGWTNTSAMRFVMLSTDISAPNVFAGYEDYHCLIIPTPGDCSGSPSIPNKTPATLVVNPPVPTIVSSGAWGTSASASYPTTYTVGPFVYPGASTLLLFLGDYYNFFGTPVPQPTVSDSCGNTWNSLAGPTNWAGSSYLMRSTVYYVQNPASCPAGAAITVTGSVQEPIFLHFLAIAGSDTVNPPIVSAITSPSPGTDTTSANSNSITLTKAGLLVSWIFGEYDAPTVFTQAGFITDLNSTPTYLTTVSENVSLPGSYESQFTISPSDGWQVLIIGLQAP